MSFTKMLIMVLLAVFDIVAAALLLVWITHQFKKRKDAKTVLLTVVGLFLIGIVAYVLVNGFSDMMYAEQPEPVVKPTATVTMDPTKAPTLVPVTTDPTTEPSVIPQPPTEVPEPTATEVPTVIIEPTATTEPTVVPQAPTKVPKPTATVTPTEVVGPTVTDTQEPTKTPDPTKIPGPTAPLEPTATVAPTATPKPTAVPGPTATPKPDKVPLPTFGLVDKPQNLPLSTYSKDNLPEAFSNEEKLDDWLQERTYAMFIENEIKKYGWVLKSGPELVKTIQRTDWDRYHYQIVLKKGERTIYLTYVVYGGMYVHILDGREYFYVNNVDCYMDDELYCSFDTLLHEYPEEGLKFFLDKD